jgi:hypothetical protein
VHDAGGIKAVLRQRCLRQQNVRMQRQLLRAVVPNQQGGDGAG